MFPPIASRTDRLTLDQVLDRLRHRPQVEGFLTLGSTRYLATGEAARPGSDYDLLVILAESPRPLKLLLTTIDGRLADVLFTTSTLVKQIAAGRYHEPSTDYEAALVERLKSGRLLFDRHGRIAQAQAKLSGRSWYRRPADRDIYNQAVRVIHYNYQHNRRYLTHPDPIYQQALAIRLHYSLLELITGYFTVRRLPWQGEKPALQYWGQHDPDYLALFTAYHEAPDQTARFAIYTEMAERALAPVGGLWPAAAVNVLLEGDEWDLDDVAGAAAFWHELVATIDP